MDESERRERVAVAVYTAILSNRDWQHRLEERSIQGGPKRLVSSSRLAVEYADALISELDRGGRILQKFKSHPIYSTQDAETAGSQLGSAVAACIGGQVFDRRKVGVVVEWFVSVLEGEK